jgi:hypothetical protein
VYHCALKIPKNFLNIFYRGRPYPFTQHLSLKEGAFYVKHGFSVCTGPGDGCAEEWLGLKGPAQVSMFSCVRANLLLHPGSNINDRNSFSKLYVLIYLKDIQKTLQGKRQGGYTQKWKLQIKVSSVGLSDRKSATKYVIPGIVDIGAKPKKAWFDFTLLL